MKQAKYIAAFLAGAVLAGTGTYAVSHIEQTPIRTFANLFGDIDGDGDVNAGDATYILQYAAWRGIGNEGDLVYFMDSNGAAPEAENAAEPVAEESAEPAAEEMTEPETEAPTEAFVPPENCDIDTLLNICPRSAPRREITVYNRQNEEEEGAVDFSIHLSDEDYAIIEQFAAENFPEDSTLAERLHITHQWIHKNVDYAYPGELWASISELSYVDAIFNQKCGQCLQYNGAMASVLAYYGYDVHMVRGWTRPGVQHYWTECVIAGTTYVVECGNLGKNGDYWQYFFKQWDTPGPYQLK